MEQFPGSPLFFNTLFQRERTNQNQSVLVYELAKGGFLLSRQPNKFLTEPDMKILIRVPI